MTAAPLSIDEGTSLEAALRLMDEHSIRHLPVVGDGRLQGIISSRDLLDRIGDHFGEPVGHGGSATRVGDVMTRNVVTASPGDDLLAAAGSMLGHSVGCLPVTENGRLLGMLSGLDLLEAVGTGDEARPALEAPIGLLLGAAEPTLAPWSTLDQAEECMETRGVRHLPVVEDGELVGIVSDRDLRRAAGRGMDQDTAVHSLMTEDVATVKEDCPLVKVARLMHARRIGSVVVTGESGGVHVVTTGDLLEQVARVLQGAADGQPSGEPGPFGSGSRPGSLPAT